MDSLLIDTPMTIMVIAATPLVLFMWIGLMTAFGLIIWTDCYRLGRPHEIIEARIVDQRLIEVEVSAGRTTIISHKNVYRLRYEYEQRVYEVEHLVISEEHLDIDTQAKTFRLHVPRANPANASPEESSAASSFAALMLMLMGYIIWETAPVLLQRPPL